MSEPPVILGRGLSTTTGAIGIMIALAVLWTMMPTEAGRTAVVSVRSTLATSSSSVVSNSLRLPLESPGSTTVAPATTISTTVVASTIALPPPMPTYNLQQTKTVEDGAVAVAVSGSSLVITTAFAVEADSTVQLLLTDGRTATAQVLFVDQDQGLAVLTTDTLLEELAFEMATIAPGDELTLVGETAYTFTIGADGNFDQEFTYDDSVREGTPVMNQDGDLVGLCSNSSSEHFVALGDFAVLRRALAGWAGLHDGDVILAINDAVVGDDATFVAALAGLMPGDIVQLIVLFANGEEATLAIQLGTN
ncbi:MAG: PDZ domain-containing protein [Actinomycetia bacterium]|nr:PDZ domain-containing protein [Actinomycetes bacterium]